MDVRGREEKGKEREEGGEGKGRRGGVGRWSHRRRAEWPVSPAAV